MPGLIPKEVTEARRHRILWCLWIHGMLNVKALCELLIKHGDWPAAEWDHARNDPYYGGVFQHLQAMAAAGLVVSSRQHGWIGWDWSREKLIPRAHSLEVKNLRAQGESNEQIALKLGIGPQLVSAIYQDPFGLREKERKKKYCGGCGAKKEPDQTICVGCVRKRRQEREDNAEALLPDPDWARRLAVVFPIDFAVTEDGSRLLVIHTERGKIEHRLARGESWERAVEELGVCA